MSEFFAYICTKTTADPYIAPRAVSVDALSRDVSDAFLTLQGGRFEVGQISFYPVQRSVPNHLLCDGREVSQTSFPELYRYLGDTQGTAADPANFVLPDYLTDFVPAPVAEPETATEGTVSTPEPAVLPPTYNPDSRDRIWRDVDSGGRTSVF